MPLPVLWAQLSAQRTPLRAVLTLVHWGRTQLRALSTQLHQELTQLHQERTLLHQELTQLHQELTLLRQERTLLRQEQRQLPYRTVRKALCPHHA